MKKMLLILAAIMSMCMIAAAQERRAGPDKKGFVILSAGPAFPIGDFSSKNLDNEEAGLAKTGFNLDLQGGYNLGTNFGVAAAAFYSRESIDATIFNGTDASVDHWQYYGLVAGPMITQNVGTKTSVDLNFMTGVANVNSPKFSYNGEVVFPEDWAFVMPLRVSGNVRFQIGSNAYFATGLNYLYMNPSFKVTALGETYSAHQKISVLNLHAGVGLRF